MPTENAPSANKDHQTFRMGPGMRLMINTLLLVLGLPFLSGILTASGPLLAVGMITLPFAGILFYFTRKVYLEVGPNGIQLQNYQLTTFVPWSNFSQLLLIPASAGIELVQPVDEPWSPRLINGSVIEKYYGLQPSGLHEELLNTYRFVDLKPFRHWVKNGALATAIGQHTRSIPQVTDLS